MSKRSGILGRILFGILCAACLVGPQAQASFIATIQQVGSNIVVKGSGAVDLTDLSFEFTGEPVPFIDPLAGTLFVGPTPFAPGDLYFGADFGISGPASFGSGGNAAANSGSGSLVGILGSTNSGTLVVPQGYMSGTPLKGTLTYKNATFVSLGITPGTYTWTWGIGVHADSFTINAVSGSVPDTGSTLMLLLMAAGLMFLATCRSSRLISKH